MMGFSCIKAVYEYISYVNSRKKYYQPTRHSGESLTRKPASQDRNQIRRLAVIKLARSAFAHLSNFISRYTIEEFTF